MNNLGIAQVNVKLYDKLPHINRNPKKGNFDISAFNWKLLNESALFPSLLAEQVQNDDETFAAIMPSKRKYYINNYFSGSSSLECNSSTMLPHIEWKPTMELSGVFKKAALDYDQYSGTIPVNQTSGIPSDWKGPIWMDSPMSKETQPNDQKAIDDFVARMGASGDIATTTTTTTLASTACAPIASVSYVLQTQVREGMWWAIESNPFLIENMPFWVTIKRPELSPTSANHYTFIVIQIGKNDPNNKFDIWLGNNMKPRIFDYLLPYGGGSGPQTNSEGNGTRELEDVGYGIEFLSDLSRILDTTTNIEVGIMTIGGRLVIYVNGHSYVYTRYDRSSTADGGSLAECKIAAGSINIYGTNISANINVSPMVFSPVSIMALPIPANVSADTGSDTNANITRWFGSNAYGDAEGSVCELPSMNTSNGKTFGCDCKLFAGEGGTCSPEGMGFHKKGEIDFRKGTSSTFPGIPLTDFYFISMWTDDVMVGEFSVPNGGCPFFFRIRGTTKLPPPRSESGAENVSDLVISIDETASAPDYFHVTKSLSVTLYNPGGNLMTLGQKQGGISVSWGWNENVKKTFTGVITNVTSNSIAGKETVTLSCQDYMYVLKNMPIVNSPFYDGMVAYYAIKDLAEKGGMDAPIRIGDFGDDYFLPSGYSFSKPAVRFTARQNLHECMMYIVKRFQAFLYFDEDGILCIEKLPGGLFSSIGSSDITMAFSSDPTSQNPILMERNATYNYDSTVNNISIATVDRETRNPIVCGYGDSHSALAFNKTWMIDEPAFGELQAARAWALDLARRAFKPIIKTSFRRLGNVTISQPLDFVTVDGQPFRLMSIKRSFNAENNDFSCSYEGEWLGP